MSDKPTDSNPFADTNAAFENFMKVAAEGQKAWAQWLGAAANATANAATNGAASKGNGAAPTGNGEDKEAAAAPLPQMPGAAEMAEALGKLRTDPSRLMAAQYELWNDYQKLWLTTSQRLMGQEADPVVEPDRSDRRFRDPDWDENPFFSFLMQSYLLNANWIRKTLLAVEGLDDDTAQKIDFYARQVIDSMAPTNFPLTNPEVVREITETKGENLVRGFTKFMEDAQKSKGQPVIRQTDMEAFEVGRNVALTPGKVIFQNELMQLIQYAPTTEQVFARPLLIVPPWINKFYILDLQPENSFVKWAADQGYTVFLISWVNPDARFADKGFDDYMTDGPLAALDAIEQATNMREVTAIGYCIGGTLLSATLAYMAAKGDDRIKAATFFAAQVDFTQAGELRVFTDEAQISAIEQQIAQQGYLDGASMAWVFNMLRANDLIWPFVINNYLLGKDPPPFDLLAWNADSTRMPAKMLSFYLRNMYLENRLARPGGISLLDVPIDLGSIKTPAYFQATKDDHIAPYPSVFKAMNLFGGPRRFVLAGSGHIAGVINPPGKNKYQHWINNKRKQYGDADAWLADATEHPGSWWPDWTKWNSAKSGTMMDARVPGDGRLTPIEDAPGSYVRVKS